MRRKRGTLNYLVVGHWFLLNFVGCCRLLNIKAVDLVGVVRLLLLIVVISGGLACTVFSSGHEVVADDGRQRIFHNDCGVATFDGDVHGGCLLGGDIYVWLLDVQCGDGVGRILTMEKRSSAK